MVYFLPARSLARPARTLSRSPRPLHQSHPPAPATFVCPARPASLAALWAEHEELLRSGVKERRAPLLSRRTRRIVIAGGAITALGVALGVILASTLRPQSVVLTVGP